MSARHKKARRNSIVVANRYAAVTLSLGVVLGIGAAGAAPALAAAKAEAGSRSSASHSVADTLGKISSKPVQGENVITNNGDRPIVVYSGDSVFQKAATISQKIFEFALPRTLSKIVATQAGKSSGASAETSTKATIDLFHAVAEAQKTFTDKRAVVVLPGQSLVVHRTHALADAVDSGTPSLLVSDMKKVKLTILSAGGKNGAQMVRFNTDKSSSWVAGNDGIHVADSTDRLKATQKPGAEKHGWENWTPQTDEQVVKDGLKAASEYVAKYGGPEGQKNAWNALADDLMSKDAMDEAVSAVNAVNTLNVKFGENYVTNNTDDYIFVYGRNSDAAEIVNLATSVAHQISAYMPVVGTPSTVATVGNIAATVLNAFKYDGVQIIPPHKKALVDSLRLADFAPKTVVSKIADVAGVSPSRAYDIILLDGQNGAIRDNFTMQNVFAGDSLVARDGGIFFAKSGDLAKIDPDRVTQGHRWGGYDSGKVVEEAEKILQSQGYSPLYRMEELASKGHTSYDKIALDIIEGDSFRQVENALSPSVPDPARLNDSLTKALKSVQENHPEMNKSEALERIIQQVALLKFGNASSREAKLIGDTLRKANEAQVKRVADEHPASEDVSGQKSDGHSVKKRDVNGQGQPAAEDLLSKGEVQIFGQAKDGSWQVIEPGSSIDGYKDFHGYERDKEGNWQEVKDPEGYLREASKAKTDSKANGDAKAKEQKAKTEADEARRRAKEEADRKAKEEADRKAKEEADRKAKEEADRKAKEEADRKAKEEADRKAKEEADRKAKEEADRKAKEEADRKAKEEADRKAKEEADRKAKEEADRKAKEEADRKAKEEADRKAKEEADRKAKEEADRKAKEEADRKAKEEADRKAKEEADRKAKEEADRKAKEEADRKAKEEADRKAKEEADRKAKEEADRKAKEEADRKAKEEADRKAKEEADRRSREEADRRAEDHRREERR